MNTKNYFKLLKSYNLGTLLVAGLNEIYRKIWRELIRGSYAQNYEDLIIDKLIKKEQGVYLEIGGYHPTRLSNTYYFYKKGWRGTIVEPNPEVKDIFEKMRPGDKFINAGISNKNSEMNYYRFLIPALNTFSKMEADKNVRGGHKLIGFEKVKTIEINEVVDEGIDLLSLDTEGFDEMILKAWPWKVCRPKIICVEAKGIHFLETVGYNVVATTKNNTIFVFGKLIL